MANDTVARKLPSASRPEARKHVQNETGTTRSEAQVDTRRLKKHAKKAKKPVKAFARDAIDKEPGSFDAKAASAWLANKKKHRR